MNAIPVTNPIKTKLAELVRTSAVSFISGSKVWISFETAVVGGLTRLKFYI